MSEDTFSKEGILQLAEKYNELSDDGTPTAQFIMEFIKPGLFQIAELMDSFDVIREAANTSSLSLFLKGEADDYILNILEAVENLMAVMEPGR